MQLEAVAGHCQANAQLVWLLLNATKKVLAVRTTNGALDAAGECVDIFAGLAWHLQRPLACLLNSVITEYLGEKLREWSLRDSLERSGLRARHPLKWCRIRVEVLSTALARVILGSILGCEAVTGQAERIDCEFILELETPENGAEGPGVMCSAVCRVGWKHVEFLEYEQYHVHDKITGLEGEVVGRMEEEYQQHEDSDIPERMHSGIHVCEQRRATRL